MSDPFDAAPFAVGERVFYWDGEPEDPERVRAVLRVVGNGSGGWYVATERRFAPAREFTECDSRIFNAIDEMKPDRSAPGPANPSSISQQLKEIGRAQAAALPAPKTTARAEQDRCSCLQCAAQIIIVILGAAALWLALICGQVSLRDQVRWAARAPAASSSAVPRRLPGEIPAEYLRRLDAGLPTPAPPIAQP